MQPEIMPSPAAARLCVRVVGPGRLGRTVWQSLQRAGVEAELWDRRGPRSAPCGPPTVAYLTVPDREIAAAAAAHADVPVLLHASGACDLTALAPHPCPGSLHPLMSFPGPELACPTGQVPAAVAGEGLAAVSAVHLAHALGWTPFPMNGDRRLYHAAAVVAGNFSAALLYAGAALLESAGVPAEQSRDLLLPLVRAGLDNAAAAPPHQALTGPVTRGDEAVLEAHRAAIAAALPALSPAYAGLVAWTRATLARGREQ